MGMSRGLSAHSLGGVRWGLEIALFCIVILAALDLDIGLGECPSLKLVCGAKHNGADLASQKSTSKSMVGSLVGRK